MFPFTVIFATVSAVSLYAVRALRKTDQIDRFILGWSRESFDLSTASFGLSACIRMISLSVTTRRAVQCRGLLVFELTDSNVIE